LDIRWKFKYSKNIMQVAGTQTAALAFGGSTPSVTGATEEYDGTSWTTCPASLSQQERFRRSRNYIHQL
jgi:hypothetical protein